jgi:hypothetical protein
MDCFKVSALAPGMCLLFAIGAHGQRQKPGVIHVLVTLQ